MKHIVFIGITLFLLVGCNGGETNIPATASITEQIPPQVTLSPTLPLGKPTIVSLVPTSTPTLIDWKVQAIIPNISPEMVAVYQRGLSLGRNPDRFSKIGDCQNITPYFLAPFDDPAKFRLGDKYAYLQSTIDHFAGSWSRVSIAVHGGMNVAAVQSPFWYLTPRPVDCNSGESPLACEIRVYNPSFVIISMEESWSGDIVKYDRYMRNIVDYVLSLDIVPILATRAEPPNPTVSINDTVARIAYDYHLPLWNFWAAADPLPDHGLTSDGFHLTPGGIETNYYFDDPDRMKLGWVWRNLSALQVIDAVWHGVTYGQ
jgi:hypothetical protein